MGFRHRSGHAVLQPEVGAHTADRAVLPERVPRTHRRADREAPRGSERSRRTTRGSTRRRAKNHEHAGRHRYEARQALHVIDLRSTRHAHGTDDSRGLDTACTGTNRPTAKVRVIAEVQQPIASLRTAKAPVLPAKPSVRTERPHGQQHNTSTERARQGSSESRDVLPAAKPSTRPTTSSAASTAQPVTPFSAT